MENKDNLVEVKVELPIETIQWLEEKAKESEIDFNTYVVSILEEYLTR